MVLDKYAALELVVGKITEVERIEGRKKLYRLTVDVGKRHVTLVAGLAEYYSPEELKGKKVLVLTNLEPKKIAGVVSEGMLLAVDGEDVSLLVPLSDVPEGASVL